MEIKSEYSIAQEYYDKKEYKKAYTIFLELAHKGDSQAQLQLGTMQYEGKGVLIDKNNAYFWFQKVAKNNDPEALYRCSLYCFEDLNNIKKGKTYLNKSVQLKYPKAIFMLARCFDLGHDGYIQDEEKAIKLYKQACLLKHKQACLDLYSILKEKNRIFEFRQFVKRDMGQFDYVKNVFTLIYNKCFNK